MGKGRIAVDFDDTIAKFTERLVNLYNADYDDNLTVSDITSWDLTQFFKCGSGIWQYVRRDDFFDDVEPIEGAIETLQELQQDYDIFVVTATGGHLTSIAGKIRWLQKHMPFLTRQHWVFCGKKDFLCADYLIDDGPHNIEVFNYGVPILFTAPHNLATDAVVRANNWREVYSIITEN